jgi:hypothetical protein
MAGIERMPIPDRANPIAKAVLSGHLLTVAPRDPYPGTLCFSAYLADRPAIPSRLSG